MRDEPRDRHAEPACYLDGGRVLVSGDDERMNRRRFAATTSAFFDARLSIAWCMVGTAVYHVGRVSAIHEKNLRALNPGVQHTSPPAESGASSEAISPWM